MKLRTMIFDGQYKPWHGVVALAVCVPALCLSALQGDKTPAADKQNPASAQASMEDGMKRWMESCTPGELHKRLAPLIGKWDTETKLWMVPGAEPSSSKGTTEIKWLYEGRWLQQNTESPMMGMPMKGFGLLGYDNFKKKYVGSWVDSITTTLLTFEGNFDQTDKVLTCFGLMDEPMTGEHDKCVKYVYRFVDANKIVFEIHDLPIGEQNTKVLEVTYTRKKG